MQSIEGYTRTYVYYLYRYLINFLEVFVWIEHNYFSQTLYCGYISIFEQKFVRYRQVSRAIFC